MRWIIAYGLLAVVASYWIGRAVAATHQHYPSPLEAVARMQ